MQKGEEIVALSADDNRQLKQVKIMLRYPNIGQYLLRVECQIGIIRETSDGYNGVRKVGVESRNSYRIVCQ